MIRKLIVSVVIAVALAACGGAASRARANIQPTSGSNVMGTADFVEEDGKVTLTLALSGAEPGERAVHLHDKGDCGDNGNAAGGHWTGGSTRHGKPTDPEHHLGDIGNVTVRADGTASFTMTSEEWTVAGDGGTSVVGHALIVHGGTDDYVSQPAGDAGVRVGCGVVELVQ